jgi:hypothetical protein
VHYPAGHCQTKSTQSAESGKLKISSRKLVPFSERGNAVLFVNVAAVEVAVVVEMIVDRGMGDGEIQERKVATEIRRRSCLGSRPLQPGTSSLQPRKLQTQSLRRLDRVASTCGLRSTDYGVLQTSSRLSDSAYSRHGLGSSVLLGSTDKRHSASMVPPFTGA